NDAGFLSTPSQRDRPDRRAELLSDLPSASRTRSAGQENLARRAAAQNAVFHWNESAQHQLLPRPGHPAEGGRVPESAHDDGGDVGGHRQLLRLRRAGKARVAAGTVAK